MSISASLLFSIKIAAKDGFWTSSVISILISVFADEVLPNIIIGF